MAPSVPEAWGSDKRPLSPILTWAERQCQTTAWCERFAGTPTQPSLPTTCTRLFVSTPLGQFKSSWSPQMP